jgi:hypothetical protein
MDNYRLLVARILPMLALILLLFCAFGPTVQVRYYHQIVGETSLLAAKPVIYKLGLVALILIYLGGIKAALDENFGLLTALAYGALTTTVGLIFYLCRQFIGWGTFHWGLLIPVYITRISKYNSTSLGWIWFAMLLAATVLWLAGGLGPLGRMEVVLLKELGGFFQSGEKTARRTAGRVAPDLSVLGDTTGEILQRLASRGLVFLFCFCVPPLGFFLWKYLDNEDSPHAGTACIGWISGAVIIVGGGLLRFLLIASRV